MRKPRSRELRSLLSQGIPESMLGSLCHSVSPMRFVSSVGGSLWSLPFALSWALLENSLPLFCWRGQGVGPPWQDWYSAHPHPGSARLREQDQSQEPLRGPFSAIITFGVSLWTLESSGLGEKGPPCMGRKLLFPCDVWKVCSLMLLTRQS